MHIAHFAYMFDLFLMSESLNAEVKLNRNRQWALTKSKYVFCLRPKKIKSEGSPNLSPSWTSLRPLLILNKTINIHDTAVGCCKT